MGAITFALGNPTPDTDLRDYPHVVLAIYEDGTLIWSEDHVKGGAPYFLTTLPTKSVQEFKTRFFSAGLFKKNASASYCFVDMNFNDIYLKGPDGYMKMRSSHEAIRSEGLTGESGEQDFRARWSGTKRSLLELIPPKDADGVTTVTIHTGYFQVWITPAGEAGSN